MADINKINSFTSTRLSSSNFFNRIIAKNNFSSLPTSIRYKRGYLSSSHESPNFLSGNINNSPVRQTRHLRGRSNKNKKFSSKAQASPSETRVPTGRIDTYVFQPIDDENSAISRSQRSPDKNKSQQQQRNKAYHCQRQDVARKAYLANTVVRAKAESMSSNRVHNYSVTFRILERYKLTHLPIDDTLRLTFSSDTKDMNCEIEGRGRPYDLVKAQIQQSKEYYLFLNSHGMHNYTVVGMPVLKKKRNNNKKNRDLEQIRRVVNKNFVPADTKDTNIINKQAEEQLKYKDLEIEVQRPWNVKTEKLPIIIGAYETIIKDPKFLNQIPGCDSMYMISKLQQTVIMGTCYIVRKFL
ncbi:hypothetical protein FQA39_LY05089 [Lamprigera yunnana]|nr:hypothetical protein FQA39_LY05089 [Lamprigera yunnana]